MKQSDIDDFKKIGVDVILIYKSKENWVYNKDGREYNMAPAQAINSLLSPTILGANKIIEAGCHLKKINNPESGFYLLFSTNYFPNCDVKLNFKEIKFDGWVYSIESINLNVPSIVESIWVCPYLSLHYNKGVPKVLYLGILGKDN